MNNYDKINLDKKYKIMSMTLALVPLPLIAIAATLLLQAPIQPSQAQYQMDQTSAGSSDNSMTNASNANISSSSNTTTAESTISIAKGSQNADNNQFYVPLEVTVKAGNTLTWKNDDTAIHTATSGKDATPDGKFDTSLISPGQSSKAQTMPSEPGEYSYFCTLHPWNRCKINVAEIFQERGDYCLYCWQEIAYPSV
jgi:plastocyanin